MRSAASKYNKNKHLAAITSRYCFILVFYSLLIMMYLKKIVWYFSNYTLITDRTSYQLLEVVFRLFLYESQIIL